MLITPVIPGQTTPHIDQVNQQKQQDAKARAMSVLMGHNGQAQAAVPNQNSVSVEEVSAASPKQSEQNDNLEASTTDNTTSEAPSEEVKTDEKEASEPLSAQYAVLARKEKQLRAKAATQEQAFKAREAAIATKEAELASKSSFDQSKYVSIDELKRNAFGTLSKHDISYDQISQEALMSQSPEAQMLRQLRDEMLGEIKSLKEEQQNTKKSYEEQQQDSYRQAVNQITLEAKRLVTNDPNFETIKETGSVNDVVELITRTFEEDGTLLSVEEAAQAVEDHLIEEVLKLSRVKKIQDKFKPVVPQQSATKSAPEQKQQENTGAKPITTLTNSVQSTRRLTAKERALLAFKGELNKS